MDNMYQRIKLLAEQKGIAVSTMCEKIGISPSRMSYLRHGRTKRLSPEYVNKIASFLGTNSAYLVYGDTNNVFTFDMNNERIAIESVMAQMNRDQTLTLLQACAKRLNELDNK